MGKLHNTFGALKELAGEGYFYSLAALQESLQIPLDKLPISVRIVLESLLRNVNGKTVREEDVVALAEWGAPDKQGEIPFIVSRVLLQDFTGVPLLVDLAAMRDAVAAQGGNPLLIEPSIPVDLVVDHSVQVDRSGTEDAFDFNLRLEFERNQERYRFLKWGQSAFANFRAVPPGIGIVHQVNLEYLADVVVEKEIEKQKLLYFDTLVGTDSHTTMINGLGVVGWGVGGIEAEAALLGLPVIIESPQVVGVHLKGCLPDAVGATDLALYVTELLRRARVVNQFVEFFGEGVRSLSVAARATIANMAPEYGATMGLFPIDEKTLEYLLLTGRSPEKVDCIERYTKEQNLFGHPKPGDIQYSRLIELDLSTLVPSVAGPKRPQDRLGLSDVADSFQKQLQEAPPKGYGKKDNPAVPIASKGDFSKGVAHSSGGVEKTGSGLIWSEEEMVANRPFTEPHTNPGYLEAHPGQGVLRHGSVVIAAITSCTNTSNPELLVSAALLAKKAVQKGLYVNPLVKTSLAPGSRVVTDYLNKSGLQAYLDRLGFHLVGYGCTTCIGNSGPLDEQVEKAIREHDLIVASVLSGNRNFEARIHSSVKANFLMSPPLVVAFALAGNVNVNIGRDPIGRDTKGKEVFLRDIWPTPQEIEEVISRHLSPEMFKNRYAHIQVDSPIWKHISVDKSDTFPWDAKSTYIQKPPYFAHFSLNIEKKAKLEKMRCLALFGDSVTTDHISPAGAFKADSPAGAYLLSLGVKPEDFNSYGSRRGNHHVMLRGTFANVRLKNQLASREGGYTTLFPEKKEIPLFEACQMYEKRGVPLIIFAGQDYGMGSSRDWAAKGTCLLGVKVVVAKSFERIHKSNLIGMGVLPLELPPDTSHETLGLVGDELFSLGWDEPLTPRQHMTLDIVAADGKAQSIALLSRLDTPMEVQYYLHGGIMSYVLRKILQKL